MKAKRWSVEIYIDEHEETRETHAEARLHTDDATNLIGKGCATASTDDPIVPEIGDELSTARALYDLACRLLEASEVDVEQVTHDRPCIHF